MDDTKSQESHTHNDKKPDEDQYDRKIAYTLQFLENLKSD